MMLLLTLYILQIPGGADLYSYFVDFETGRLENWEKRIPSFTYDPEIPFFEILVPTIDTVRFGFLMETLLDVRYSVLFTGFTGVGKVRWSVHVHVIGYRVMYMYNIALVGVECTMYM